MKNLIKNNQKIFMVPKDIKGALSTFINKIVGSSIDVNVSKADLSYYKLGDVVEMFTVIDDGMLYFKPRITDINAAEGIIRVEFDKKNYDQLQRREYTRIDMHKEFILKDDEKSYVCTCLDLSAGGMKIQTEAELDRLKDYAIEFSLESNIPIECFFRPVRVTADKDGETVKNIVSGRFIALKNIDKIAIVQFCFKKQMENTSK